VLKSKFLSVERVLDRLQRHHASSDSHGCLLGVAMAQLDPADTELAEILRGYLRRLEQAFERTIRSAQSEGRIAADARAKDVARNLVAMTQGMALMGRITPTATVPRSIVRAALHALRP